VDAAALAGSTSACAVGAGFKTPSAPRSQALHSSSLPSILQQARQEAARASVFVS